MERFLLNLHGKRLCKEDMVLWKETKKDKFTDSLYNTLELDVSGFLFFFK